MNAIQLLKQQHQDVDALFAQYEQEDDVEAKRQLFIQIADAVSAHATIEEKIFYPGVRLKQTESILLESVHEHLEVKKLIAKLLDLEPADNDFDPTMMELKEDIQHHVEEEQGDLFPKVEELFTRAELENMGNEMEALFEELEKGEPRLEVPAQTDAPASLD